MDTNREKKPRPRVKRAGQELTRKRDSTSTRTRTRTSTSTSTSSFASSRISQRSRLSTQMPSLSKNVVEGGTSQCASARLYDKRICDRFADMSCALNILAEDAREQNEMRASELIAQSLGIDLVGNMRAHARSDIATLHTICMKYDLTVAPFITNEGNVQQYFIALSSVMIDSELCHLGMKFVKSVHDIIKFIDMVREHASARRTPLPSKSRARVVTSETTSDTSSRLSCHSSDVAARVGHQCSRVSSRARANAVARAHVMDECVACCAQSYSCVIFDGIYSKLNTASVYATRAIDDIEPIVRADNSSEMKCARCNTFMRALEQCVIVCDKCGCLRDINVVQTSCKGPSTDGDIMIAQDDTAHGGSSSMQSLISARNFDRHLRTWLERLQAIEPFVIPACDLDRIRNAIECESIGLSSRTITYAEVVRALKICALSDSYSEHVPNIVKMLKGRAPPVLSHEAQQIILRDFVHIMEVYTSNGIGNIGNKPYYPFFIAKIIKRRFPRGSEPRRLIDYISSQGRETVCKNDEIYRMICEHAPAQYDLKYEPEDV